LGANSTVNARPALIDVTLIHRGSNGSTSRATICLKFDGDRRGRQHWIDRFVAGKPVASNAVSR